METTGPFRCGNYCFDVAGDYADEIRTLFRDLLVADATSTSTWEYLATADGVDLMIDGDLASTRIEPSALGAVSTSLVTRRSIDADPERLHLHAAAVSDSGGALVVAAPSGSGKSTLVCALVQAGAVYLTDEAVAIAGGGRLVEGLVKPISVKKLGTRAVQDITGLTPTLSQRRTWEVVASELGEIGLGERPLRSIVMYRHGHGVALDVRPIARAEVIRRLLADSQDAERFGPASLAVVAHAVAEANCIAVEGDDAAETALALLDANSTSYVGGELEFVPEIDETQSARPARSADTSSVVIDGQAVIVRHTDLSVFELDPALTWWWSKLDGRSLERIVAAEPQVGSGSLDIGQAAIDELDALGLLSA